MFRVFSFAFFQLVLALPRNRLVKERYVQAQFCLDEVLVLLDNPLLEANDRLNLRLRQEACELRLAAIEVIVFHGSLADDYRGALANGAFLEALKLELLARDMRNRKPGQAAW